MPDDLPLSKIPPDGTLSLLAFGYRGVTAWRAARGTAWLDEERHRTQAAAEAQATTQPTTDNAPSLSDLDLVIVSGLPRSGTSMLMQMLDAGGLPPFVDGERQADDSNPRGYYEHARVRALAKDKTWIKDADGLVTKVVAPLLPHLPTGPRYRVVLLTRSLDQVLRSQRRMLGRLARPAAPDQALRPAYERYLRASRAWAERHETVHLLEIDHADVLTDPTSAALQIAAFLDTPLDIEAMVAVVDPSLHRERAD